VGDFPAVHTGYALFTTGNEDGIQNRAAIVSPPFEDRFSVVEGPTKQDPATSTKGFVPYDPVPPALYVAVPGPDNVYAPHVDTTAPLTSASVFDSNDTTWFVDTYVNVGPVIVPLVNVTGTVVTELPV
jgi:hypothetical protein